MRPWEALLEIFVIFGCPWGPKFLRKCGFSGFSNAVPKRSTFWDISGVSEGVGSFASKSYIMQRRHFLAQRGPSDCFWWSFERILVSKVVGLEPEKAPAGSQRLLVGTVSSSPGQICAPFGSQRLLLGTVSSPQVRYALKVVRQESLWNISGIFWEC